MCISDTCQVSALPVSDGAGLLNPQNWEQNKAMWLHKANVWIEYAPVCIDFLS